MAWPYWTSALPFHRLQHPNFHRGIGSIYIADKTPSTLLQIWGTPKIYGPASGHIMAKIVVGNFIIVLIIN
jgi:hypothetical protein